MFAPASRARVAGLAAGYVADLLLGDPRRRPSSRAVRPRRSGFGAADILRYPPRGCASHRRPARFARWRASPSSGLPGADGLVGRCHGDGDVRRARRNVTGPHWPPDDEFVDAGDVEGARRLLPSLCGRDPAVLDEAGLTRAALESVAENTSDAQVAPLLWAAAGGVPAVLVYRGANTLDAMIGNRSPRYARFGWAAARFDDAANFAAARVTAVLVALCAPVVGGSPAAAVRAWRRDAARHPSPNAGVVEAAFAGALGVRLGGPTQYAHKLEIRPTLGDGRPPRRSDLARAVRLSRAVQLLSAVLAIALSAAGRSGRRASPRG